MVPSMDPHLDPLDPGPGLLVQGHPGWAGTPAGWAWPKKKFPGNFFLTGTGLLDPVRDGKFPGNGLIDTGQTWKLEILEAPGPGILALTLPRKKIPWEFFFSYRVK